MFRAAALATYLVVTADAVAGDLTVADVADQVRTAAADRVRRARYTGGGATTSTTTVKDRTKPKEQTVHSTIRYKTLTGYDCDCSLVSCEQLAGKPLFTNYCVAMNGQYCFELGKKGGTKPWAVKKMVVTSDPAADAESLGMLVPCQRPSSSTDKPPYTWVMGIQSQMLDLTDLGSLPGFGGFTARREGPALRLTFTHELQVSKPGPGAGGAVKAVVSDSVTLDAANGLLPLELHQQFEAHGSSHRHSVSYTHDVQDSLVVRTAATTATKVVSGDRMLTDVDQLDETVNTYGPIPEGEFRLTAFGLPEPPGLDTGRRTGLPTYAWALLVAASCGLVWAVLRARRSR